MGIKQSNRLAAMPAETAATADPVALHYTLGVDDLLDGFTAQRRAMRRPWYVRWLSTLAVAGVFLVITVRLAVSGDMTVAAAVALAVLFLICAGLSIVLRRVMDGTRLVHRLTARQMIRGNPGLSQPMQTSITVGGVHLATAAGQSTLSWTQHPLHVESERSFVLLASERPGAAVLVLPKRGVGDGDLPRLRALLAAHTARLG
jgi:hypothetical protein